MTSLLSERQRNKRANCEQSPDDGESDRVPEKHLLLLSLMTVKPLTVWITTNWKILQEMGIPDHLTCLLGNLDTDQEVAIRTGHGTTGWFKIGK